MSNKFLHREDAPFKDDVWEALDAAIVGAAKSQLSARRLLHIDGPHGLGLKAVPNSDQPAGKPSEDVTLRSSGVTPVAEIQRTFTLPARDIAAFEDTGLPFDLMPAVEATMACARQEDELVFQGSKPLGVDGLLSAKGTQSVQLKDWKTVGSAAENVIAAATKLDDAGYHGPYTLGLAPALYNLLFRRYPQGNATEMEHVQRIVTEGVVKAPAIDKGGVLIASGRQFARILIGQDLAAGFIGPADGEYEFSLSESLALWLAVPGAVCVLK